jgi:tetratricopeptide (TPR) repeat protein
MVRENVWRVKKEYDKALADYDKAIELDNLNYFFCIQIGAYYMNLTLGITQRPWPIMRQLLLSALMMMKAGNIVSRLYARR